MYIYIYIFGITIQVFSVDPMPLMLVLFWLKSGLLPTGFVQGEVIWTGNERGQGRVVIWQMQMASFEMRSIKFDGVTPRAMSQIWLHYTCIPFTSLYLLMCELAHTAYAPKTLEERAPARSQSSRDARLGDASNFQDSSVVLFLSGYPLVN